MRVVGSAFRLPGATRSPWPPYVWPSPPYVSDEVVFTPAVRAPGEPAPIVGDLVVAEKPPRRVAACQRRLPRSVRGRAILKCYEERN